jgi:hypothetical protein
MLIINVFVKSNSKLLSFWILNLRQETADRIIFPLNPDGLSRNNMPVQPLIILQLFRINPVIGFLILDIHFRGNVLDLIFEQVIICRTVSKGIA